ncbi:MAG: ROK family transcriptional regulator [Anaerolineaceae bacterium]
MDYPLTITASAMREINRSAILEIIRRESPISRSAIADRLEVSLPTVMRIVEELETEGFVRPQGEKEWSGGRRRPLIEFNAGESVVLGIDLGASNFYGAISDLGGNVVDEASLTGQGKDAEENYTQLLALIDRLLQSPRLAGKKIRGIGVGVPGPVTHHDGNVTWAPALNWRNLPLKDRLSARYNLPLIVDNDMNLAALGELWFGLGQNARNIILITVTTGIGAGIIIDRALYRGSTDSSGEIGMMLPGREFLGKSFGDFGALETRAALSGLLDRAREQYLVKEISPDDIFKAASREEPFARSLVDEMEDQLAVAITNLIVSFDPDLILLCGGLARYSNYLMQPILDRIHSSVSNPPRILVSQLDRKAVVMGAITNVLHNTSNFYFVRKLT